MTAILTILKSLSWQAYVMAMLALAAGGIYAVDGGRIALLRHQLADMTKDRNGLQVQIADARQLAKTTEAAYQARDAKTKADQKEINDESQRFVLRARDDNSSARAALQQLLDSATPPRGGQAASDPKVAEGSTPAEGAGLRPDLLGSVGDEALRYAEIADVARIGRAKCEADYDALTPYGDD